eukprot:TRINITY_DN5179_c0_g1_i2.p1 TRINITY_DN5179_c0_g1~~TRINITY_DN5179_c0_g1_i2.p1  ORF type:complete len:507 (+),score=126.17 TRINITY_DN5179_c0_g1_i2:53-1573(+)
MTVLGRVLVLCYCISLSLSDPIVHTPLGIIEGFYSSEFNEDVFLGVPYVEPPTRFRPSPPKQSWSGILQAQEVRSVCYQMDPSPYPQSEDCLHLNIYAPRTNTTSPLPVMLWIHGGAFVSGSGSYYNGTHLAQRGVIVVTINYRLGAFGFLESTELEKEDPSFPSLGGMNGILDQLSAIEFIRTIIGSFGGDPNKITIFGESAGGLSICYLLVVPRAKGLFQQAIIESGSCLGPWGPIEVNLALNKTSRLMGISNVSTVAALRSLSPDVLNQNSVQLRFSPALDTYILPQHPISYYQNGDLNIPPGSSIIIGTNTLDTLFVSPWFNGPWPTNDTYLPLISSFFPTAANAIYSYYPPLPSPKIAFQKLNGHVCLVCASKTMAELMAPRWNTYVYEYRWDPTNPGYPGHFAEVPQVFGESVQNFPFNPTLSAIMMDYWSSFAKTGRPSSSGNPGWLTFGGESYISFNDVVRSETGYNGECLFWEKFLAQGYLSFVEMVDFCFLQKILS